jgi:hypothetical protein
MKVLILCFLLIGCTNPSEHLRHRTVTDSDGCKYFVEIGAGEIVFLHQLSDIKCTPALSEGGAE